MILCQSITEMKNEYLKELKSKMDEITKKEHEKELVELIITDIRAYFHKEETDFETTQHLIGMDLLFRG